VASEVDVLCLMCRVKLPPRCTGPSVSSACGLQVGLADGAWLVLLACVGDRSSGQLAALGGSRCALPGIGRVGFGVARRPRLSPTNSSTRPWCAAAPGQPSGRFNGASSSKDWARGRVRVSVWVSSWSSTLCDLGIFVDQPAEPVAGPGGAVLVVMRRVLGQDVFEVAPV
jgi:hypothetical protein